jgi:hypothetical protein
MEVSDQYLSIKFKRLWFFHNEYNGFKKHEFQESLFPTMAGKDGRRCSSRWKLRGN